MKYAKKMIMVPEVEYNALIKSKGGDNIENENTLQDAKILQNHALLKSLNPVNYLANEKALLDAKIMQNLEDPTVSEDIKAYRHSWLSKERRTIMKHLENRPQKVIIVNPDGSPSNFPPYMGISSHSRVETASEPRKIIVPSKRFRKMEDEEQYLQDSTEELSKDEADDVELHSSGDESVLDASGFHTPPSVQKLQTGPQRQSLIHPTLLHDLFDYVSNNKDNFEITALGKIQSNRHLPIEESSYKEVLRYLVGKTDISPRGTKFLRDRLLRDPNIKEMVNKSAAMWGEGKKRRKILVKVKTTKIQGMVREPKPFKPIMWARL